MVQAVVISVAVASAAGILAGLAAYYGPKRRAGR